MRILLAEETKYFQQLVGSTLADRFRSDVVVAGSAFEARGLIADTPIPFDLAIVSASLTDDPDSVMVSDALAAGIPCIALAPTYNDEWRDRFHGRAIIDYVVKSIPSGLDYLLELVSLRQMSRGAGLLLVEDGKEIRKEMAAQLAPLGFQIIEAANGEDALDKLEEHGHIRLIVTDDRMPKVSGTDMIRQIRAMYGWERFGIIGVASGGPKCQSIPFIKLGANDFLNYPFHREELLCRVMRVMQAQDMAERLSEQVTKDGLTGVHNRRFFYEAGDSLFASALREHVTLAAARVDIDHLQAINDQYGVEAGDAVVKAVAAILRRHCRQTDLVARMDEDEFAILAVNMNEAAANGFFEKLRQRVEQEVVRDEGREIRITISTGICLGAGLSLDGMLKNAGSMLHKAKAAGCNRIEVI